jgi:monofunctional biosynthetic peptidoglycan transglycosylase
MPRPTNLARTALRWLALFVAGFAIFAATSLTALRYVNPPLTAVQLQRWLESFGSAEPYEMRRTFVPLTHISPNLRRAVIAAEDGRFYQHFGLDWIELRKVIDAAAKAGEPERGASTITQQLVKNLFLTTRGSYLRKVAEVPLALLAELILSKDRIFELYLNVIEWGPGVFGAEAAARLHYQTSSAALSRDQAARLAACLPSPRRWRPQQMDRYSAIILGRMRRMGY